MSSSIDYFPCPKCGCDAAFRDQDNRTGEIVYGCPNCDWQGEPCERKVLKEYDKFITGYVAQHFIKKGKRFICVSQNFIASDELSRENDSGDAVSVDVSKEVYFPYEMKQPQRP